MKFYNNEEKDWRGITCRYDDAEAAGLRLAYINETWEGGSLGDWTVVGSSTCANTWIVGATSPYVGTYSAYVSSDGSSQAYTNYGGNSWCHLYKAVKVGDTISFYWKCFGEGTYDYGAVYLVPSSITPFADTEISSSYKIGSANYSGNGTWNNTGSSAIDVSANKGDTMRLVFSFTSDSGGNSAPGFCIDNIIMS